MRACPIQRVPQVHNDGQTDLEFVGVRENSVPQTYDPATGQRLGRSPDSTFMVSIRDDWHWAQVSGVLRDDEWYEMAYYVLPSSGNGTSDGALRVICRPYGL